MYSKLFSSIFRQRLFRADHDTMIGLCAVGLLVCVLLAGFRRVHDFHASVTQMQYNAKEKVFEISVRVFTDDFENALSKATGRSIRLDPKTRVDSVVARYVRAHFAYMSPQKEFKSISYVGYENEADAQWIYLELPFTEPFRGGVLKQNVLMELFDDQVNMVNVQYQGQKKTFVFRKNQPIQEISL